MKRYVFLILITLFASVYTKAQSSLLEEEVIVDDSTEVGPNKRRFFHTYVGYGVLFGKPETDSVALDVIRSYEFTFGYRFKYRLAEFYAIGFDMYFNSKSYGIKQDSLKLFPNNTIHEWERLTIRSLSADVYNRFNYGKRGNYVGKFIDIGAYADWGFNSVFKNFDKHDITNNVGASSTKQVHKGLVYLNPINYGLIARVGFNRFVFYGTYRFSDIFKSEYIFTELPRITAGIQIGAHK